MRAHSSRARDRAHRRDASRRPLRMHEPAQQAAAAAQQPLGVLREEAALAHHAEGRRPDARRGSPRVADLRRERREPARELLVRLEPVADRALVAVVELHEVDRDLVRAPSRAPRGCAGASASLTSSKKWYQLHQPAWKGAPVRAPARAPVRLGEAPRAAALGVAAERDADALDVERARPARARPRSATPTSMRTLVAVAAQVDDADARPALEHAGEARGAAARPADDASRRCDSCQPRRSAAARRRAWWKPRSQAPGREGGLAGGVELARAGRTTTTASRASGSGARRRRPAPAEARARRPRACTGAAPALRDDAGRSSRDSPLGVDARRASSSGPRRCAPGAERALGEDERRALPPSLRSRACAVA